MSKESLTASQLISMAKASRPEEQALMKEQKRHVVPIRNMMNGEVVAFASTWVMKGILEQLLWDKLKSVRVQMETKKAMSKPVDSTRIN